LTQYFKEERALELVIDRSLAGVGQMSSEITRHAKRVRSA